MVSIDIQLFDLACAEAFDVTTDEVLVQHRILLQITRGEPADVHD